jgi:hypothetical protein
MEGTFLETYGNLKNLLPEMVQLISEMAMPEEIQKLGQIQKEITTDDFYSGFKSWKESTSMSPSGRHLGHYKAIIDDPEIKKMKKNPEYVSHCKLAFLELFTKLVNIPVHNGFVPDRWCKSITVMIEKDPGSPRIEQLHIIHLFEADYNFSLKLLWGQQMVHWGEDAEVLGNQQDGSRPGQQALNSVHKKNLSFDLSRILQTALALFDNDASGCYDWIVVALATIAAR